MSEGAAASMTTVRVLVAVRLLLIQRKRRTSTEKLASALHQTGSNIIQSPESSKIALFYMGILDTRVGHSNLL
jgi:hypothetical protein